MVAASDEEGQMRLRDGELRRSEGSLSGVATVRGAGVAAASEAGEDAVDAIKPAGDGGEAEA